jgi:hypothetical protein
VEQHFADLQQLIDVRIPRIAGATPATEISSVEPD